jgi:cell division protein FtsQ
MKKNKQKKIKSMALLRNFITASSVLFAVVFVFYAAMFLKDAEMPSLMQVSDIQVNGELNFLDKNDLVVMIKENIDGGYFTVDLHHLREILMQQPWIKQASLRRQWPIGLHVLIDEKKPVAYWNEDSYISELGEVFKPVKRLNELALPALSGPQGRHIDVWRFMNVLYGEMALLDYDVVSLDLDERRAWQLVISDSSESVDSAYNSSTEVNSVVVKLGRFETQKRLQRLVRVLPRLLADKSQQANELTGNRISVIDMRYPNGFSVQMLGQQMSAINIVEIDMMAWEMNEAIAI